MMRFEKGSKVEVFNKKEVSMSWRSAQILSGDDHTYNVQYYYYPGMDSGSFRERVSREFVRPCPPLSPSVEIREVRDTVEVFEDFSWKVATILGVIPGDYYMVRLLGSSMESIVYKLNIRDRLLWLDDEWILMGKVYRMNGCNEPKNGKLYDTADFYSPANLEPNDFYGDASSVGSCSAISVSQKRSPNDFAHIHSQVSDSICSDAKSFVGSNDDEEGCSLSISEQEVPTFIHEIELRAYCCTLEALHASC